MKESISSGALLSAIVDNADDAIFATDREGRFVLFNHAAQRNTGKSAQEAIGHDATVLFPPDEAERLITLNRQVMESGESLVQESRVTLADETRHFLVSRHPLRNDAGEVIGMFGVAHDITERKRAETQLRLWAESFQHAGFGLAISDAVTNTFLDVNPAFAEQHGYSRDELIGKPVLMVFPSDIAEATVANIADLDTKEHAVFETEHISKDGRRFPVMLDITTIHSASGLKTNRIAYAIDITNKKQAERAVHESEQRYRNLFEHMINGYAYCRMLFEHGKPVDFIYLHVNPAFEALTGLRGVQDRRVSDVIPGICESDPNLIETYGRVAAGGKPEHFETYVKGLEMWFSISVYCPQPAHFVAIFDVITDRKKAESYLLESATRYRHLLDNLPQMIWQKDADSVYVTCNASYAQVTGTTVEEINGKTDNDLSSSELAKKYRDDDRSVMAAGVMRVYEETWWSGNGERIVHTTKVPLRDQDGKIYGTLGISEDVTERIRVEDKLRQDAKVFESTTEGVMITDLEGNILSVNQAFTDITGYSEAEVLGRNPRLLKSSRQDESFYQAMWASLYETGRWQGELWNRRKNGEIYPEWQSISTVKDPTGRPTNYVAVFSDITQIKRSESQLNFLAHHDPLTELPNRLLFNDRLEHAIQRAKRVDTNLAILFIDLDHFKTVNDSLGHPIGDRLLSHVANVLKDCVRAEDTVARLGGDEFVVLLEGLDDIDYTGEVAKKILQALANPFELEGHPLVISASIGISTHPIDGHDATTLVRNADSAMYRAKQDGRNTFHYYSAELTRSARERFTLEAELRRATEREEFELHYQPQLDVATGLIVGAEALVRWQHPQSGMISPVRFIPLAEETGLIVPLGEWVLQTACEQYQLWRQRGLPHFSLAVNLSPRQFRQKGLVKTIHAILDLTGMPPEQLELEITEGAIMEQGEHTRSILLALKSLGIRLAIDDFGTGYSSLAHLRRFPINVLKIDQSFMRDIPNDPSAMEIAATIIAMARNLHLKVLAEGVETGEQLAFLMARNCDYSQGYLHSRPLTADEFEALLRTSPRLNR